MNGKCGCAKRTKSLYRNADHAWACGDCGLEVRITEIPLVRGNNTDDMPLETGDWPLPSSSNTYRTWDSMQTTIIGLCGKAGAGKDAVANLLAPVGFKRLAFADKLKNEVACAFLTNEDLLNNRALKEMPLPQLAIGQCRIADFIEQWLHDNPFIDSLDLGYELVRSSYLARPRSPRYIMQQWGTQYRRSQNDRYWINALCIAIDKNLRLHNRQFVVTDVRFANEVDALRQLGAKIVAVARPVDTPLGATEATHASEQLDYSKVADLTLTNDGDIESLNHKVQAFLAVLKREQSA